MDGEAFLVCSPFITFNTHFRSSTVSSEMPVTSPVAESNSGDVDPSMCSQNRTALQPVWMWVEGG